MIKQAITLLALVLVGITFFVFTNPDTLNTAFLMIPALILFAVASTGFNLFCKLIFRPKDTSQLKSLSVLVGVFFCLVFLIRTSGGIVFTDILLIGLTFLVGYIYIKKF